MPFVLHSFSLFFLTLHLSLLPLFSAPDTALPLPDTVQFAETAKLPPGVNDRTLTCSIVSEDDNVLVVETSTLRGTNARFSLDKTLLAEVKRGDPSIRPFAELATELPLPPESGDPVYYDDKIDRIFRPFLKKYPQSVHAQAVRDAEKAHAEELLRVSKGEFRESGRWTEKALLTPADLKAIELIRQTRKVGSSLSLPEYKKLAVEAKTCFASEFFPLLLLTFEQTSKERIAKLPAAPPVAGDSTASQSPPTDEKKKEELAALEPLVGWNVDSLNQAVAKVREAEILFKNKPPEQVALPLNLILQSRQLMPQLLARDRILRQQASAASEKAIAEGQAGKRSLSLAWWHAALQIAAQLPPPENQKLSESLLNSLEKSFSDQTSLLIEKKAYDQAKEWFQDYHQFLSKTPSAASRMPALKKRMADLDLFLKKQINQNAIDSLRKALAEYLADNNFEAAKINLALRWEEIKNLNPTAEEITIFSHAALDQAKAAFQAFQPISGCQLLVLANRIEPDNPRVKTWVFSAVMVALALFLIMLFPIFWIFARSSIILENLRFRFRMKKIKKKTPKWGSNLGHKE